MATELLPTGPVDLDAEAEALVRSWCGWHIYPSRTDDLVLDGSGSSLLLLPTLHLTDVADVTEDGNALDPATDYSWSASGYLARQGSSCYGYGDQAYSWGPRWTRTLRGVALSITHGYDQLPLDVASVVRAISTRMGSNAAGLMSKTVGPFSETYNTDMLATEQAVLAQYKLPWRP